MIETNEKNNREIKKEKAKVNVYTQAMKLVHLYKIKS